MGINILDGVKSAESSVSKEAKALSEYVQDQTLSLVDRVESYQDIISLEVGDTSLTRIRNIERDFDLRQVYVKFEGGNPSGTQKDRIAFAQVMDAMRRGYETITLATCGNYGASMALACELAGVRCIIYIPESYHTEREKDMTKHGAEVRRHSGSYEQTVEFSSQEADRNDWYDANPGGGNTSLQLMAYAEIALEIYDLLRDAPRIVAVPVSNGTLLAGIYRGFVSLYKRGKTSRIPQMLAASSSNKNPIISSFLKGLEYCEDLDPQKIKESKVNEPLINSHSFDGEEALYALRESKGYAFHMSDRKMVQLSRILEEKEGLKVLPASTAGLLGLLELHEKENLDVDRYVAILTAKY